MIHEIKAKFTCDECGSEFWVLLDPGYDPPNDWTLHDAAIDALGGNSRNEDNEGRPVDCGAVDDGRQICGKCVRKDWQE